MADAPENKAEAGTISIRDLARLLEITDGRIRQLVDEGYIPPPVSRGFYSTAGSIQGYIRSLRDQNKRNEQSLSTNRMREARAEEFEIRNAKARNELVHIDEVETVVEEVTGLIKEGLDGIAASVTRDLGIRRNIESAINDVLGRAAKRLLQEVAALKAGGGAVDPDAEADA